MAPHSSHPQPFVRAGEHLNEFLPVFWQRQIDAAEQESSDYRHPILPLARIKKVMKSDPDVKMIAADGMESELLFDNSMTEPVSSPPLSAPILFCKACEMFIEEITARAFIIADSNKRRTLSRSDIAAALSKSDQFDFLIDIVPRDLQRGGAGAAAGGSGGGGGGGAGRKNSTVSSGATAASAVTGSTDVGPTSNNSDIQTYHDNETSVVGKSEIVEQASALFSWPLSPHNTKLDSLLSTNAHSSTPDSSTPFP
ncbi:hypothetical protein D9757_008452 [Collybiopsis confluens]|uniref:Core Histone H2A/H2B/H3 domain-containing protein n=1 Tax=Collybiopsis confluens TaxID=2823264 RepID=A0A8H5M658_9AGAR|nr:hypothetical protein D9757_008452 [Collybiopsis confluens]